MPAPNSRRRPAIIAALPLVLLALAAPVAAAETLTVAPTLVDDDKEVLATVESVRSPQARARIGGTVDTLKVAEGDRVKKGDLLAVVVDPKLKLQLASADAKIAALEAKLALVQTELDRVRQLRQTGAAPQSRLDDTETQMVVTRADIAAAKADRAAIDARVDEGRVEAPDDGRILQVKAVAGQVIMAGEPVATLATADYVLKLRLPERHARFMHEGDAVWVAGRGLDTARSPALAEGHVVRVYPELDQGRVVADAVAPGTGDYFVGERVRVRMSTGKRETILVPERAVVKREGLTFVRLEGRGEVPVQTGQRPPVGADGVARIEILTGLVAGDRVVLP